MKVCKIVWGLLYDKFGYRKCVMFIGSCVAAGMLALPLLEFLGEVDTFSYDFNHHQHSYIPEVDSLEVTILWTVIMITLYSLMPGTLTVNYR